MANDTIITAKLIAGIKTSALIIGVIFVLLSTWILIGNMLIMMSIRRFRRLQTLTNRFVFSLALADFIAGLFIFWQSCFSWFPQLEGSGLACSFRFVNVQPSLCSAMHMVVIATDRYLAVLHPLRYHEFMTTKMANILIALAWMFSIILVVTVIGTARYVPGVSLCTLPDIVPRAVLIVMFHVVMISLIIAMFFMYGRIFWAARKQMQQIHAMEVSSGIEEKGNSSFTKELKAAKQLSTIVLVFTSCHVGFLIGLGIGYSYRDIMSIPNYIIYYKISLIIIFFNSALNPVVYALRSKEFKEAFKRILCPCLMQPRQGDGTLGISDHTGSTSQSNA